MHLLPPPRPPSPQQPLPAESSAQLPTLTPYFSPDHVHHLPVRVHHHPGLLPVLENHFFVDSFQELKQLLQSQLQLQTTTTTTTTVDPSSGAKINVGIRTITAILPNFIYIGILNFMFYVY